MSYKLLSFLALLLVNTSSCTQQAVVPCQSPSTIGVAEITYSYNLNNSQLDLYDSKINRVSIYIFDSNGYFHSEKIISDPNLIKNNIPITLHLPIGNYTVVTFGGNSNLYQLITITNPEQNQYQAGLTPTLTHIDQLRLVANVENGVIKPIEELFGSSQKSINVNYEKVNKYNQELVKTTHLLNISVSGIGNLPTKAESPLQILIKGNNTMIKKDHSIDNTSDIFSYTINPHIVTDNEVRTSLRILRIDQNSSINIEITNLKNGQKITNFDLSKVLFATPLFKNQTDLDREDEYNISLNIDANQNITMKVNGWYVVNVGII